MASVNDLYPSKYFKAADLGVTTVVLTIGHIEMAEFEGQKKPVISFLNADKGFVCNKTNANIIAGLHGDNTDDWRGKQVEMYPTKVEFSGRMVDTIRVRQAPAAASTAAPANDLNDSLIDL